MVRMMKKLIEELYGLKISEIKPQGPVWKINSQKGYLALKRMHCDSLKIKWLCSCLEALRKKGLCEDNPEHHAAVAPIIINKKGLPFFEYDNKNYILTPWYTGKIPNFNSGEDLRKVALLYGKLHRHSTLIKQPGSNLKQLSKPLNQVILEKLNYLKETQKQLLNNSANLNRIDRAILKWSYFFIDRAEVCWDYIHNNIDRTWYNETSSQGFCHQDPAPGNIIVYKNKWILIDFELASNEYFITELSTLMRRALQFNDWNPQIYELILAAYQTERQLNLQEIKLLIALLAFPHPFWRLCQQRFNENLKWTEKHFQSKLWKITSSQQAQTSFSKKFFPPIADCQFLS
jgi:CotS family spore coat protein